MLDSLRFRVATLIAGDLIDRLAISTALRAGDRQHGAGYLAGYRDGTKDARLLAAIRGDNRELRLIDGGPDVA